MSIDDGAKRQVLDAIYDETGTLWPRVQESVEEAIKRFPNFDANWWVGGSAAIGALVETAFGITAEDRERLCESDAPVGEVAIRRLERVRIMDWLWANGEQSAYRALATHISSQPSDAEEQTT